MMGEWATYRQKNMCALCKHVKVNQSENHRSHSFCFCVEIVFSTLSPVEHVVKMCLPFFVCCKSYSSKKKKKKSEQQPVDTYLQIFDQIRVLTTAVVGSETGIEKKEKKKEQRAHCTYCKHMNTNMTHSHQIYYFISDHSHQVSNVSYTVYQIVK